MSENIDMESELTFMMGDAEKARLMVIDLLSDHFDRDEPTEKTMLGIRLEYQRIRTKLEIAESFLNSLSDKIANVNDTFFRDFTR